MGFVRVRGGPHPVRAPLGTTLRVGARGARTALSRKRERVTAGGRASCALPPRAPHGCHSERSPPRCNRVRETSRRAPEESTRPLRQARRAPHRPPALEPAPRSVRFRCRSVRSGMAGGSPRSPAFAPNSGGRTLRGAGSPWPRHRCGRRGSLWPRLAPLGMTFLWRRADSGDAGTARHHPSQQVHPSHRVNATIA